jgi:hypothetical protein
MGMARKRAMAMAARGMVTATRVAGDEKGNGNGNEEGNFDQRRHHGLWPCKEGGRCLTAETMEMGMGTAQMTQPLAL